MRDPMYEIILTKQRDDLSRARMDQLLAGAHLGEPVRARLARRLRGWAMRLEGGSSARG